jgi:hypothetical protein
MALSDPNAVSATSEMIAAQAKSLRGTFLRDRRLGDPVTYGDLADAVELIEHLASDVLDLARAGLRPPVPDLSNMPPVLPSVYDLLEQLIHSEQIPPERVAELLQDEAFALWLSSRQRRDPP